MTREFAPGCRAYPLEECLVVVREGGDRAALLGPASRAIWESLAAGASADEVVAWLIEDLGLHESDARNAVAAALSSWDSESLLGALPAPDHDHDLDHDLALEPEPPTSTLPLSKTCTLFGRSFSVQCPDAASAASLENSIGHWSDPRGAPELRLAVAPERRGWALLRDGSLARRFEGLNEALGGLLDEALRFVHAAPDWLVAIHGAAVAVGEGECVVIPASAESGKSTLAAGLALRGFGYMGEDLVPIDRATRQALAAPMRASLREGSWDALAAIDPRILDLPILDRAGERVRMFAPPLERAPANASVRALAFARFDSAASFPPRRVAPADAFARLVETGSSLQKPIDPVAIGELVDWIARVPSWEFRHRSLAEAEDFMRAILAP